MQLVSRALWILIQYGARKLRFHISTHIISERMRYAIQTPSNCYQELFILQLLQLDFGCDNRNISKKNHLWTMQKLSQAYFGPHKHIQSFSKCHFPCGNLFGLFFSPVCIFLYGCEFDISSLHKSNTSWANTYFEYIRVISYRFSLILGSSHFSHWQLELIFVHRLQT